MALAYGFLKCKIVSDPTLKASRHKNEMQYHLLAGAWSFRSIPESLYPEQEQLPFRNMNEFRIPAQGGHEVSVQF